MLNYTLHENGSILLCSEHKRIVPDRKNGNKKKTYRINLAIHRKLHSSCVNLWAVKQYNLTFFELGFPFVATEDQANKCLIKFLDNLKANYGLKNYVSVKERGETGNLLHFHCIFDLPYHPIKDLNSAWCSTFKTFHDPVSNALRLPPPDRGGSYIRDRVACCNYISNYIQGGKKTVFEQPCYFMSREIRSNPKKITNTEANNLQRKYKSKQKDYLFHSEIKLIDTFIPSMGDRSENDVKNDNFARKKANYERERREFDIKNGKIYRDLQKKYKNRQ